MGGALILSWMMERPEGLVVGYWKDQEVQASDWGVHGVWANYWRDLFTCVRSTRRPGDPGPAAESLRPVTEDIHIGYIYISVYHSANGLLC